MRKNRSLTGIWGKEMDRGGVECHVHKFQKDHVQKNGLKEETVTQQGQDLAGREQRQAGPASYTLAPLRMARANGGHGNHLISWKETRVSSNLTRWSSRRGILFLKKRFRIGFVLGGFRESEKPGHEA